VRSNVGIHWGGGTRVRCQNVFRKAIWYLVDSKAIIFIIEIHRLGRVGTSTILLLTDTRSLVSFGWPTKVSTRII